MTRLDELPPDQRAALSLLLRQRKSYAEVADLLQIPARAVHDRAHAALAVLAPREARALEPAQRLEIGDYLLGQQASISERLRTRTYLGSSEPARNWARAVAAELAELSNGQQLPEIPVTDAAGGVGASARAGAGAPAARPAPRRGGMPGALAPPTSRLGGALVLAAVVVAIVVAVVLLTTGGGNSHSKTHTNAKTTSTGAKGPAVRQLVLHSRNPKSRAVGVVEVLREGGKRAFYIEADNLPATKGFFYAVWLYNSSNSAEPLSKAPPVGKNHRVAGGALLPSNAGNYHHILLDARDRGAPDASRPDRAPGPVQPVDGSGRSLPGFIIPAGSSSSFTARSARMPPSPISLSIHGR